MSKDSSIVTMLFKIHSLFTKLIHPWSGLLHFYEFHHTMIAHLSLTFLCLGQVKGRASFIGSVLNVFLIKIETKVEENCKANSLSPYFSFLRFIFWKKQDYRYIHCKSIQFKNMMDDLHAALFSAIKCGNIREDFINKNTSLGLSQDINTFIKSAESSTPVKVNT